MDIIISNNSQQPIYKQIYQQIVVEIATGGVQPHACLPSMRLLAKELGVSVITTQKTYEKLEADGYTYTVPGKGCFISERKQTEQCDKLLLAAEKLCEDIPYLKSLEVSLSDAKALLSEYWDKT